MTLHGVTLNFPDLIPKVTPARRRDRDARVLYGDGFTTCKEHDMTVPSDEIAMEAKDIVFRAPPRSKMKQAGGFKRWIAPDKQQVSAVKEAEALDCGEHGRLDVGVERPFHLGEKDEHGNEVATWARVHSLRTHAIDLVTHNAPYLKQTTGTLRLTVDASPWLDGSPILKSACYAAMWSMHVTDDNDENPFDLPTRSKEMALMRRPRPAFLAFAKETRKAGNVIGRVLGVTLRHGRPGW